MDGAAFDRIVRRLELSARRRTLLASLAGAGLAGGVATSPHLAVAKKKKKVTICRKGQTLSVAKKKKQKHLKPGDTAGACPATTRPPATTTLPPRCPAATPNSCARLDSCQPSCAAGHAFDAESCACVCSPATTCCVCTRGAQILEFPNIATETACSEACANAGGTGPVFAGGNGKSAVPHPTEAQCTITCTPEPMTCPAGFNPDTCGAGLVCCPPEVDGGCCDVDFPNCCSTFCCLPGSPICCPAGGCCSADAPRCCGAACCANDSACCAGDGDCGAGQICQLLEGTGDGCCVAGPGRSRRSQAASMMRMAPATPRRQRGR